jgi:hypothetical protein
LEDFYFFLAFAPVKREFIQSTIAKRQTNSLLDVTSDSGDEA